MILQWEILNALSQLNCCQHLTNSLPELQGWLWSRPEGAWGDLCLVLSLHRVWPAAVGENRTPTVQVKYMPFSGCFYPLYYRECLYFQHGWAQWKSELSPCQWQCQAVARAANNWQLTTVSLIPVARLLTSHQLLVAKVNRMVAIY